MSLALSSTTFEGSGLFPRKYAQNGDDVSPPLEWSDPPDGTRSFALMLDSIEDGQIRNHWIIYNIDGSMRELPEEIPRKDTLPQWTHDGIAVRQGRNDFGRVGYTGPLPATAPPYINTFTLYALDCKLHVSAMCSQVDLLAAMQGHMLAQAELTAIYTA